MAYYLIHANYVGDGVKGLIKEGGTARRAAAAKAIESLGGKMHAFYFAFGETDAYVIGEAPDNVTAAALALAISASGVVTIRTTVLLTAEEMDAAAKKTPSYRPPGK